ncbi:hypothetical protein [Nodularia sp. NIES-3585]|uniref:hypothetical protein n=1 Tax=Nodularia sp. NIES-3585 TaxID=1973477 RepID=UPI000B66DC60|nr:hypothetical protein [Nodularia sp. NIES-3585]GAX35334.1 hypothetical protein NIES3585_13470 [Nodularia sp. NIES-3585]
MSSMDKNVNKNKEQQYSEGQGEKRKSGQSNGSSNRSDLDRVNTELAKPNLTESAKKALLERKKKLEGK